MRPSLRNAASSLAPSASLPTVSRPPPGWPRMPASRRLLPLSPPLSIYLPPPPNLSALPFCTPICCALSLHPRPRHRRQAPSLDGDAIHPSLISLPFPLSLPPKARGAGFPLPVPHPYTNPSALDVGCRRTFPDYCSPCCWSLVLPCVATSRVVP